MTDLLIRNIPTDSPMLRELLESVVQCAVSSVTSRADPNRVPTTPRHGDLWAMRVLDKTHHVLVYRTRTGALVARFVDEDVTRG